MTTERMTERPDGSRERVIERDDGPPAPTGGAGVGGVIIGLAVLALVAVIAFFLLSQNRNDALRTDAVTGAAHSVSNAAGSVGDAAQRAADSTTGR